MGRIRRLLARRDGAAVDDEPDALADAQAEAVQLPMSLTEPRHEPPRRGRRCAFIEGFSKPRTLGYKACQEPHTSRPIKIWSSN